MQQEHAAVGAAWMRSQSPGRRGHEYEAGGLCEAGKAALPPAPLWLLLPLGLGALAALPCLPSTPASLLLAGRGRAAACGTGGALAPPPVPPPQPCWGGCGCLCCGWCGAELAPATCTPVLCCWDGMAERSARKALREVGWGCERGGLGGRTGGKVRGWAWGRRCSACCGWQKRGCRGRVDRSDCVGGNGTSAVIQCVAAMKSGGSWRGTLLGGWVLEEKRSRGDCLDGDGVGCHAVAVAAAGAKLAAAAQAAAVAAAVAAAAVSIPPAYCCPAARQTGRVCCAALRRGAQERC
eukprot:1140485-Pelagomonas_calceolata.AAC.2